MSCMMQGHCTTATVAPGYYNQYLNTLANCGIGAAKGAQFVGATPLQQQAFGSVGSAATSYQPALANAGSAWGAANQMAMGQSPLASAQPYLQNATGCLRGKVQGMMNPYVHCVVNQINTLGQQNIQQNLAPQATAGAVGSGQFGSQRGAQVLGQTVANANQQILGQQANALMCGYKTALCGVLRQNTICQQAGSTAAQAASQGAQNLGNLAVSGACIAGKAQQYGLSGVCALNKMGANQQAILQNQQCFPLSELTKASALLNGKSIPTVTCKTSQMSGLGQLASAVTTGGQIYNTLGGASGLANLAGTIAGGVKSIYDMFNPSTTNTYTPPTYNPTVTNPDTAWATSGAPTDNSGLYGNGFGSFGDASYPSYAHGGLVCGAAGCASTPYRGALPARR